MTLAPLATDRRWLEREGRYESALVFEVGDAAERIIAWRKELGVDDPIAPHFTLCFLGRGSCAQMQALWRALEQAPLPDAITATVDGVDGFRRAGAIRNIHLRLRSDAALRALHAQVLAVAASFAFFAPGPYVGDAWTPHVSISDAVDLAVVPALRDVPATLRLVRPHLIGQRLDAVRISA